MTRITQERSFRVEPNFWLARNSHEWKTFRRTEQLLSLKIMQAVKHLAMGINTCRWLPVMFYIICEERPWKWKEGERVRLSRLMALEKESPLLKRTDPLGSNKIDLNPARSLRAGRMAREIFSCFIHSVALRQM